MAHACIAREWVQQMFSLQQYILDNLNLFIEELMHMIWTLKCSNDVVCIVPYNIIQENQIHASVST